LPAVAGLTNEEISLLLGCLPPDDVSLVLGALPIERQREVLQRAGCADPTDDNAIRELGARLEQVLHMHRSPPGSRQPEVDPLLRRARAFLAPSRRDRAPELVSVPDSAPGLEPEAFSVELLATLDRATLRALYERLSDADWSVALAVASPAVRRRLTASLPASAAAGLQKALRHKRPVRLRDLEAVHRRIGAALAQLRPAVEAQ
jgi:flagellar motor switch protein FliG